MKRKIIYLQHMKMKMSNNKFKHKVNQKTEEGGFRYLINEQNNQKKIAKINARTFGGWK